MLIVPERLIADLVSPDDAFAAIEACFAAMARGEAYNFPVVREALGEGRQYGFKSGLDRAGASLGVKAGGIFRATWRGGLSIINRRYFCLIPNPGDPWRWWGGIC